jgi:SAM-dependent methyltransferase
LLRYLGGWAREAGPTQGDRHRSNQVEALGRSNLEGRTVLDLGCGTGDLALATLARGATRATGVDLGPGVIEEARALARERLVEDRSTFQVDDAARVHLDAHDVVILNRVLCYYPQVNALLDNSLHAARHIFAFTRPRRRQDLPAPSPEPRRAWRTSCSGSATGSSEDSALTCTVWRRSIAGYAKPGSARSSRAVAAWSGTSRSTSGRPDRAIRGLCQPQSVFGAVDG